MLDSERRRFGTSLTFPLGNMSLRDYVIKNKERVSLTQQLLQNEISRLRVWSNVTADPIKEMPASIRVPAEGNITSVRTSQILTLCFDL